MEIAVLLIISLWEYSWLCSWVKSFLTNLKSGQLGWKGCSVPNWKNWRWKKYFCCLTYLLLVTNSLGDILQLNFKNTHKWNKYALMKDANIFGVAWADDGAIIRCMPLLNMLSPCGEEPPGVISIFDGSDHMSEGGKKGAEYIGQWCLILCLLALMHSFSMVLATFKKLKKIAVQHFLKHFVFMEARLSCLYLSVTWITSDQSKWVLNSTFSIFWLKLNIY